MKLERPSEQDVKTSVRQDRDDSGGVGWRIALLMHISLLLALYGGATLSVAARLAWDPSLYVPLRLACPTASRAAAAAAPLALALLVLPHLAVAAALLPARRRPLLIAYVSVTCFWLVYLCGAAWLAARRLSGAALQQAGELSRHVTALLDAIALHVPHGDHIRDIVQEAMADAPRNAYAAAAALALLLLLLLTAAALALATLTRARHTHAQTTSGRVRARYCDGRLQPLLPDVLPA